MSFTQVPVTGYYPEASGGPDTGHVQFTLRYAMRNTSIIDTSTIDVALVNAAIPAGFTLAAVDDLGTTPGASNYYFVAEFIGTSITTYNMKVSYTQSGIDLATVPHTLSTNPVVVSSPSDSGSSSSGSGAVVFSRVAAAALSGDRVVTPTGTDTVDYASNTNIMNANRPLWLTQGAAASGAAIEVIALGILVEPSWSWVPLAPIFLGTNGMLTQIAPSASTGAIFLTIVGYAIDATSMMVDPQPTIVLV